MSRDHVLAAPTRRIGGPRVDGEDLTGSDRRPLIARVPPAGQGGIDRAALVVPDVPPRSPAPARRRDLLPADCGLEPLPAAATDGGVDWSA